MLKIFFFKNCAETEVGRLVIDLFYFFKKALLKVKQAVSALVLIYFGRAQTQTNFIIFHTVDPELCSILIFYKGAWD